ncbi:MAG: TIGR00341 family protein, partial [Sedimenticola sp.]|nr:TIGR00341 family protein [Sedimenticola sp.]
MKYLEIVAAATSADTISAIAEKGKAEDCRLGVVGEDGMQQMRLLVSEEKLQWVLDALQHVLGAQPTARILILSVEASLPRKEEKEGEKKAAAT